ncbi:MAG: hypothetical protein ACFFAU_10175 [Candidatus Hodarchaeota archaeon]
MVNKSDLTSFILAVVLVGIVMGGIVGINILFPQKSFEEIWIDMIKERQKAINTLPTYSEFSENVSSWEDYADKCIIDILKHDDCWTYAQDNEDNITGFRAYVKNAHGWKWPNGYRNVTELMAGIDVLWPMFRYLQLHPNPVRGSMIDLFINELAKYYDSRVNQTLNRPGETRHDSWYYMENSVWKYGHLYMISNISTLQIPYFMSLETALKAARNFGYLFPQFFNLDLEQVGSMSWNYCTAGLLAYSLIDAYEMTDNIKYLHEAENCIIAMRNRKPLELLYEPQELGCAAAAAARLTSYDGKLNYTVDYRKIAYEFFYAQEQLIYYDGGKNKVYLLRPRPEDVWRDGLHSPFYNWVDEAGIEPPAYKECIESTMIWVDYLKYIYFSPFFSAEEPLKIMNLNRIKTFDFFSPNIPDIKEREYGPITLQYIPYEDVDEYYIHDYEDKSSRYKAGFNGKQVYGAGETIWNYLLYEALASAEDRNVLIVNLNVFDKIFPPKQEDRIFIVWNPYEEERILKFTLKFIESPYLIYVNNSLYPLNQTTNEYQPESSFSLKLPGKGSAYITFKAQNFSLSNFYETNLRPIFNDSKKVQFFNDNLFWLINVFLVNVKKIIRKSNFYSIKYSFFF